MHTNYVLKMELHWHSRPDNLKKAQAKKPVKSNKSKFVFREIAFLVVFKFFPSSKIGFWPYLKLQKMEFDQKKL